jgi:hypothetical protein
MAAIILPLIIEGPATGNTGVGSSALLFNNGGISNTAFGLGTLKLNQNGDGNTAIGSNAMLYNTTGDDNTGVGRNALSANSTGLSNTAIGSDALSAATGNLNTAIGKDAGILITTGQKNTVLGPFSGNQGGYDIRTLSNYVVIADGDGNPRIIVDPAGLVSAPGGFSGGGGGGGAITINNKTAAYTVVSGDLGEIINCTANTFTVSLTAAATLGAGFNCWIWNTGTGAITIDPSGAETIDGIATIILRGGEGTQIVCDGANWQTNKSIQTLYAENTDLNAIRPVVSGDRSVGIGSSTTASGFASMTFGYASSASNTGATALGYLATASGTYSLAINGTASAQYGTAVGNNGAGGVSIAQTGSGAMALQGSNASGADSFSAAVGSNNSAFGATGFYSVAIGRTSRANNSKALALGDSTIAGDNAAAIGVGSNATGLCSVAIGNTGTQATGSFSFALNAYALSSLYGKYAYASGRFANDGDAQAGAFVLRRGTTDATATVMTADNTGPSASNQVILPNNSAHAFTGTIIARQQAAGGTQSAAWTVSGLIRREANAASTTLVASTVTVISNVPGWTLALSADTTNGGLAVTATGAAATNIRWVANIETSEVTYA